MQWTHSWLTGVYWRTRASQLNKEYLQRRQLTSLHGHFQRLRLKRAVVCKHFRAVAALRLPIGLVGTSLINVEGRVMAITMNDLTISPEGVPMDSLLSEWSWAMPEPLRPVLVTAMGDVFAQGESGAVYLVDTVAGTIVVVAESGAEFQKLLRDTEFVTDYMFPSRIVELRHAGKGLGPGEVYSHKHLLVLGGDDETDNIEATDVSVHVSIHGQVHRQIKDLPEGTSVSDIEIE